MKKTQWGPTCDVELGFDTWFVAPIDPLKLDFVVWPFLFLKS